MAKPGTPGYFFLFDPLLLPEDCVDEVGGLPCELLDGGGL